MAKAKPDAKPVDDDKKEGDIDPMLPTTMESLRGKTPDELVQMVEVLDAHLKTLHQDEDGSLRSLDTDEQRAFDLGMSIRDKAMGMIDEHRRVAEIFKRRPTAVQNAFNIIHNGLDEPGADVQRMTPTEARERALKTLDNRQMTGHLRSDQKEEVERQIRRDPVIAKRILATEFDAYRSAWQKAVTRPQPIFTSEEQEALLAFENYRAASEGTTTAGGFGIPVYIDPSIILTAQGSGNPFLELARQVTVNTNAWKGVSSAGVTWAFQTEAAATTDNAPTLAQPTVTVFMARGFIPYSIEVGQDYPAFAEEMSTLLTAGYDELLVDKFTRGSGSNEPQGLLTAISANTNTRVTLTTAGVMGAADPYKVWAQVPLRFRRNASWLMTVNTNNVIRQLATANVYHALTVTLPENWADSLFKKGVYESPYMSEMTTWTTTAQGVAVVGDFSNYLIARRGGMSVELIPALFDVTNNRPTGQRGWFAYARIGGGSVNDLAFRGLFNS
jgi:HK97 family phage major capsid protein